MKKIIALAIMVMACAAAWAVSNVAPSGESLNYKVMYKWGVVNKQAGHANLTTNHGSDGKVHTLLTASTEKWADRFYKVRDTLRGHMDNATCEPLFYEKISHEGGEHKHDKITYTRTGNKVTATCDRFKQKKNKPAQTSQRILEAEGLTLDMLSAYYYMRAIDYSAMSPGEKVTLTVFSGKRKETLTITYRGIADIEVDGQMYNTYHILFKFAGEGGKKTSDDMDAWISTDADRVPIKLEGKLPVGKVQCFFTGRG